VENRYIKNKYLLIRIKIAFFMILKGKVSFKKILNATHCWVAQKFRFIKSQILFFVSLDSLLFQN